MKHEGDLKSQVIIARQEWLIINNFVLVSVLLSWRYLIFNIKNFWTSWIEFQTGKFLCHLFECTSESLNSKFVNIK